MSNTYSGIHFSRSGGRRHHARWLQNAAAILIVGFLLSLGRLQPSIEDDIVKYALDLSGRTVIFFPLACRRFPIF